MQAAHVAALHASNLRCTDPDDVNPPAWAERVFVLHAATPSQLVAAVDGLWTPGLAGCATTGDGDVSWFVEPDRFFDLTAVAFDAPTSDRCAELRAAPLWAPPSVDPGPFPHRDEVRPLLAAASRRRFDGSHVWALAAPDPAETGARRRALWLLSRDKEPPLE